MAKKNISIKICPLDTDTFCGMVKVISCGWAKSSVELNALQCGLTIGTKKRGHDKITNP